MTVSVGCKYASVFSVRLGSGPLITVQGFGLAPCDFPTFAFTLPALVQDTTVKEGRRCAALRRIEQSGHCPPETDS